MKTLTIIPRVGKSIATDLYHIGSRHLDDLKGKDPQQFYDSSNQFFDYVENRHLLDIFRCAVYFKETPTNRQDNENLLDLTLLNI